MFSSLMRFEWRSLLRYLWIIWASLLAASILMGSTGRIYSSFLDSRGVAEPAYSAMYMLLKVLPQWIFWLIFAAEIIITCILVIARFYNGLLGREGYLMHTLPVKTWQLIDAKGLAAGISVLISGLLAILSIVIMVTLSGGMEQSDYFSVSYIFDSGSGLCAVIQSMELILMAVTYCFCQVYKAYAAMSIGQLAGRHRILISAGVFVGFNIVLSVVTTVLTLSLYMIPWDTAMEYGDTFRQNQQLFIPLLLLLLIELVVFHVIAERMLSRRLNLL